ncbi:MAG: 4-hydroxyphenylpyruvate dioxygenase [Alphaproteobacteria bacterium]
MTVVLDNPLGTEGFEFIEFTGPNADALRDLFNKMGLTVTARHKSRNIEIFQQGDINFILNNEQVGQSADFNAAHMYGGASAVGFKVKNAAHAFAGVRERGATAVMDHGGSMGASVPAIEGIGGSLIYLIDQPGLYMNDFDFARGAKLNPNAAGLTYIDHLTHNVEQGDMKKWAEFYEKFFNFRMGQSFDINGDNGTGLLSMAMSGPCLHLRIPLNEGKGLKGNFGQEGQIERYLLELPGEGIQHIALGTDNIYKTIAQLRNNGLSFMPTPKHDYYEEADKIVDHGENIPELERLGILIDGSNEVINGKKEGTLLQIFTQEVIGPVFFEVIQRKGNSGFGHGNFQRLFGTIEEIDIQKYKQEHGMT